MRKATKLSTAPLISHGVTPPASGNPAPLAGSARSASAALHAVPRSPVLTSAAAPSRDPATGLPLFVLISITALVTAWGLPYYLAPAAMRLRHPLNGLLKSSGPVGLAFGVLALILFVFMWLYPLRKTAKWLAWTGALGGWMNVHIVMGLALPGIAAVHAGWHFDGLIGMGMLAMVIVSLSGIVGRYLYTHIPRSRSGLELSLEEAGSQRRALLTNLAVATALTPQELEHELALDPRPYDKLGIVKTFGRLMSDDWRRWRTLRRLSKQWSHSTPGHDALHGEELDDALKLARHEMKLAQQLRALEATRRVFAWWHVAHRPFALTALFAVIIHVAVAVWVGGVRIDVFGGP